MGARAASLAYTGLARCHRRRHGRGSCAASARARDATTRDAARAEPRESQGENEGQGEGAREPRPGRARTRRRTRRREWDGVVSLDRARALQVAVVPPARGAAASPELERGRLTRRAGRFAARAPIAFCCTICRARVHVHARQAEAWPLEHGCIHGRAARCVAGAGGREGEGKENAAATVAAARDTGGTGRTCGLVVEKKRVDSSAKH